MFPTSSTTVRDSGAALVLVLAFLVLLLGLVVVFLTRVNSETRATAGFGAAEVSRRLADMTVHLVQGQINEATTAEDDFVWTSQPGLIRVFAVDGSLTRAYRLYSAQTLGTENAADLASDIPSANWKASPDRWVDLNAPVVATDGRTVYPILNPGAIQGTSPVAGLTILSNPAGLESEMPVRWLYVLEDGSVVAPEPGPNSNELSIDGASQSKPIIGRIAFWTDDNTSRINVNTAMGDEWSLDPSVAPGAFWDVPRVNTVLERSHFNLRFPLRNEFARFPGHPASVYLSAAFPTLTRNQLAELAPRYAFGGSKGGTVSTSTSNAGIPSALPPSEDRLYAGVGELLFSQSRTRAAAISREQIENASFLLTAHSRAPEVNLFGQPRISIWPIDSRGGNFTTAYDRLITRASTINATPYYFRRRAATSLSIDGATNLPLLNYLADLTAKPVPGFPGGSFAQKFGEIPMRQILVHILDYIRLTNPSDSLLPDASRFQNQNRVSPLKMGDQRGFGVFPTIREVALCFSIEAAAGRPRIIHPEQRPALAPDPPNDPETAFLRTGLAIEPFIVMSGFGHIHLRYHAQISGLNKLQVKNSEGEWEPLFNSDTAQWGKKNFLEGSYWGGRDLGGWSSLLSTLFSRPPAQPWQNNAPYWATGPSDVHPLVGRSIQIPFPASGGGIEFRSTGPVELKLFAAESADNNQLVQTFSWEFPASPTEGFPLPEYDPNLLSLRQRWTDNPSKDFHSVPTRAPVSPRDTVRALQISHGDPRITATMAQVDASVFTPHAGYDSSQRQAHGLQMQGNSRIPGATYGDMLNLPDTAWMPNTNTYGTRENKPPYPVGLPPIQTGDFDNNVAHNTDGPFANKPDQGGWSGNGENYFKTNAIIGQPDSFFSPNRIVASPGVFGSLPTVQPWTTLLFRPQPGHPNERSPNDHLLMDLFWMPVVQPYAISEPFSTAGKVNLNFQIVPFSHIERTTALRAVLRGEQFLAIPNSAAKTYKGNATGVPTPVDQTYRRRVNSNHVIEQLKQALEASGGPQAFLSATQICDFDLEDLDWEDFLPTGDNSREKPYSSIYQKLTTRSNSFTVFYKVQTLKSGPGLADGVWNESRGSIQAEMRGSTTLERYLDPQAEVPDYLNLPLNAPRLENFYRWRIVTNQIFAP